MSAGNVLEEIRERLDRAVRYDGYLVSLCPFHTDHNPSFFVYSDNYRCASCGEFGRTADLLDRLSGVVIHKTKVEYIANPFRGWAKRFGCLSETLKFAYQYGQKFETYLDYVYNRGITRETVKAVKLGYLDGYVTFPLFQNKKIVGAVARSTKDKHYFIPNAQNPHILFIPNEIIGDTVYLVFGMFDALTLFQYGLPVMTTTRGIVSSPNDFNHIRKKIIVIPDRGEEKTAARLVAHLDWRGKLLVLDYPIGTKDINDLHTQGYEEMIHELAGG